jgi:putative PIG3 family NAD(P)H quinone oxidoreductase
MRAIQFHQFGSAEELYLGDFPTPDPAAHEIRVKVKATALNRADLLQREGKYPQPPGESPIMGLEIAGEVDQLGEKVTKWKLGDRVCGLLAGGGYAEYAIIHEDVAMPIPENLDFLAAAAIPEAFLTAFQALVWIAKLKAGETLLLHAGASGVGTAVLQLARLIGAKTYATASAEKHALCLTLGAEQCIDYKTQDFAECIQEWTQGRGVDVVMDFLGASYLERNLKSLGMDGRMVMLAMMGGAQAAGINLGMMLMKRLSIHGSTLRARTLTYKTELTQAFMDLAWAHFASGALFPVVDKVFSWEDVAQAHLYMEENRNQGKIVLSIQ